MREGIYRRDEVTLVWPEIATTETNVAPSTDTEIDCRNAKGIVIQVDQSSTTYAAADINVLTRSENSTTYDTVPFHEEKSLSSAAVQSFTVQPAGFAYMKLRADNNSESELAKPRVIVQVLG